MLDNTTKKRIDDCRDILVGKLPDPKSQIEQITIALIYKFMDDMDKESIELGGEAKFFSGDYAKYSWNSLFDAKVTATEMLKLYSESIESMEKNPNIPQLFRNIFKNAYLPYRDPETLKLFLKTIGEFEYTHSEKLGDAFEYLLSVMGSQGDAGQFRTPRHIIDFLVKAVDPGKTDTILDPACGTAGFLISAFKRIKEKNNNQLTPDERKKLIKNFIGYDISPDMVRLSLVNLYLHGFSDPHIFEYDTLTSEERWNENFDVVLANPPFMSPKGGIRPHKKFTVTSNRSEVLFVDYIAEHLNPNGRAGIIVPEGIIFQSGKAYKELRKMLVENYLYAVVSLPAGVFNPYSGVKTSILLMDKAIAKKSNKILFVKIENDGYNLGAQRNAIKGGQLGEAIELLGKYKEATNTRTEDEFIRELVAKYKIAHAVEKAKIAENGEFNLSGERYKNNKLISHYYKLIALGEIVEVKGGKRLPKGCKYSESITKHPYIRVADFGKKTINQSNLKYISESIHKGISRYTISSEDVFISIAGTIGLTGTVPSNLDGANLTENAAKLVIRDYSVISNIYLSNILSSDKVQEQIKSLTHAVGVPKLALSRIRTLKIPLPPLSVQEEIVAEIEGYQKIIDGAKMVVENYKPQIDIDPDWEMVELGEICKVKSGGTPSRNESKYWNGDIPWVKTGEINYEIIADTDEKITELGLKNSSASIIPNGTILMAMYGQGITRGKVAKLGIDASLNQACAALIIKTERLSSGYLFSILQSSYEKLREISDSRGGNQGNLSATVIKQFKIPLPPLETQKQIVAKIEKEQELVNSSKQLIEIFEQKIKDRIAKVWGE
ncbi:MAG: N-6 DNA methylase [Bacteroidales bacterium]|nr:N-6 DNA methylase [Bacteroidales bacterium]